MGWCAVCFKQYCPCPYYQHSVINRPEALACKHILAARIADAVGKIEVLDASIEDFVEWTLKQVRSFPFMFCAMAARKPAASPYAATRPRSSPSGHGCVSSLWPFRVQTDTVFAGLS